MIWPLIALLACEDDPGDRPPPPAEREHEQPPPPPSLDPPEAPPEAELPEPVPPEGAEPLTPDPTAVEAASPTGATPPDPGTEVALPEGVEPIPPEPGSEEAAIPTGPTQVEKDSPVPLLDRAPPDDTRTITISGTVSGSKLAQIRFMTMENGKAEIMHLGAVIDGEFSVPGPSYLGSPIYVVAAELTAPKTTGAAKAWGAPAGPIELGGDDITLTFGMGDHPGWADGIQPSASQVLDPSVLITRLP